MSYTETLDKLATATQAQVVAAFESWQEGLIGFADFLAIADAFLAAGGNRATALADTALAAAQDAYGHAMTQRGVPGWTRVLNGGACGLCQDLAGPVLPGDAEMYHHKGCGCTQQPVLNDERETA